ncbi:Serine/threonine-protein kinase N2 [Dirofilaria immitis]|nr:Serine/threonine-protein kinase N2 [Dirofilaria immitis]
MADVAHPDPISWQHPVESNEGDPCSSNDTSIPEELALLADKYTFSFGEQKSLQKDVIKLKKKIRISCNKQMRIKQGYVQMQSFSSFMYSVLHKKCNVQFILYESNERKKAIRFSEKEIRDLSDQISDMKDDLQTLDMYDSGAFDDGDDVNGIPNSPSEDALTVDGSSDGAGIELTAENAETVTNSRLASLQKELDKEMKVKDGLERFLAIVQTSRKLQEESKSKTIPTKTEMIVDDLLFRLRKEAAIVEGARNMIRILSSQKRVTEKSFASFRQSDAVRRKT